MRTRAKLVCFVAIVLLLLPKPLAAYSVLTHQAVIDAAWDTAIKPLLLARFPDTDAAALDDARAYAYGGSVVHDLGYYPLGSKLFSNLLHYVRSGDFVESLFRHATDVNEYAFAIGMLGHHASDNSGHALATNRVVAMMYPKLRAKFGDTVTYDQAPKQHVLVEFSFDVLHVAAGVYAPQAFHRFIGFKLAQPVLERAFLETYGLEMGDLFFDRSLTVGTFRYAVGKAIPEMTKAAWKNKRQEIEKVVPTVTRASFVFNLSRRDYEKHFGRDYARPRGFAKVVAWLHRLLPKIGPFRALAFKVPTPEAEKLFLESFTRTRQRFVQELNEIKSGRVAVGNTNIDLGRTTPRGSYSLEDETYEELVERLAKRKFAGISPGLRADLISHFGAGHSSLAGLP